VNCVKCGYTLDGLAIPGTCPECGTSYEGDLNGPGKHLPDPVWSEGAVVCLACSYSLQGLEAPGLCPECGAAYEARQLVIAGVPRSIGGGSPPRRILAAVLLIGGIAFVYTWPILLSISWLLCLMAATLVVGPLVYLLATSRRERRGVERFVLTPSGITRIPLRGDAGAPGAHDLAFTPWGDANAVELRQISTVWRRLRIGRRSGHDRITGVIFDAGIRCPGGVEARVRQEIERCIARATPSTPAAV